MTIPSGARFEDLGDGLYSELIANQVQLFYDPTTQAARAIFNGQKYLGISGTYRSIGSDNDILAVDFSTRMAECYGIGIDPVTGTDLSTVSTAGFMMMCKSGYDKFVQERADKIAADIAAAEAAALSAAATTVYDSSVPSPSGTGTIVAFQSVVTGTSVAFTDQSTDGGSQPITKWSWIFGDGIGSSTEQNPTYVYQATGTFTVSLVITDSSGTNVNISNTVTVA